MKSMGVNEIREKFLSFFESKGCLRLGSFPLIPKNDASLLLINSGMAPMKPWFQNPETAPKRRVTTCQKCIRTGDIENVGKTARHGTFFEMLGNFSFGDYFKKEATAWAWEFFTKVMEIPQERLWISVYEEDDEARDIWVNEVGVDPTHIVKLGKEDNFWEHGTGPCGPCSEIYFDRGEKYGCGKPDCKPGCDCDRYMEIWNNVFSQFNNDGNGNYTELAQKNIDTGMGLERLACVMQGVDSMFDVDTIQNIISAISEKAGIKYRENEKADISMRIIADHMRASSFLIADGVMPSNEGRGYVLRRLIRRACRHGRLLGIKGAFLDDIIKVVAHENKSAYPMLTEKLDYICKIAGLEEERFSRTVESGMNLLENLMSAAEENGTNIISGADTFKLSDTYGFPIDLTREIAAERGIAIDEEGYRDNLAEQKRRAREARGNIGGWDGKTADTLSDIAKTAFIGYDRLETKAKVLALIDCETDERTDIASGKAVVITDSTVFYGEGGGEVGDTGTLLGENAKANITDTKKKDGIYMHICDIYEGSLSVGDEITIAVDTNRRAAIRRNHSAVHLLDAALRRVLGDHIAQAGSYVDEYRGRFDFTHFAAVTPDELKKAERMINEVILSDIKADIFETDIETAKKSGAIALFGEKYGSTVRVVKFGDFSSELCGGCHVGATGEIGLFRIVSESSVAAGTRRIEIMTGMNAYNAVLESEKLLSDTAAALKVSGTAEIPAKIAANADELKALRKENESLSVKLASGKVAEMLAAAKSADMLRVATLESELPLDALRSLGDEVKANNPDIVAVMCTTAGGKLNIVTVCGKDAVAHGVRAGDVVKKLCSVVGGGGGGKPDSATAGGRFPEKVGEAMASVCDIVKSLTK